MPLAPCPECGRPVSSEAQACPGCGHPIRPVEYCFAKVTENTRGGQTGKAQFQKLLSEGWKVVDKQEETRQYMVGGDEHETYTTTYKLQR